MDTAEHSSNSVLSLMVLMVNKVVHFKLSNYLIGQRKVIILSQLIQNGTKRQKRVKAEKETTKVMVIIKKKKTHTFKNGDSQVLPSTVKLKLVITGKLQWNYNQNWTVHTVLNKIKTFKLVSTEKSVNTVISLLSSKTDLLLILLLLIIQTRTLTFL